MEQLTDTDVCIYPVTPDRWTDMEALFGPRGGCMGCWCMYWRLSRKEFDAGKGEGNRTAMNALVGACQLPGLLAYKNEEPIGWCSVGPRSVFPALNRSRLLKPVDERKVWSVVCFFVQRSYRRQGLTGLLLQAALRYAVGQGAVIVEGYPVIPRDQNASALEMQTGVYSVFQKAGFVEVVRRSETRPIMRFYINEHI
ncbi:MAG: GNAT family N-acetyltransferase [Anaerolineaceae bacterium]|nr:GNAT family N-acetyltransferase [Anaerolineaceae bacterium]